MHWDKTTKGTFEGTHTWTLATWHIRKEIHMQLGLWHFSATSSLEVWLERKIWKVFDLNYLL